MRAPRGPTDVDRITLTPAGIAELPGRLRRRVAVERSRRMLEREFAALMATSRELPPVVRSSDRGVKVAVATFGSGCWHLVLELLLAHALSLRGSAPELFVCDVPALPMCDERTSLLRDPHKCPGCIGEKQRLLDMGRIRWRGLSEFVHPAAVDEAAARLDQVADTDVASFMYRGWPLGEWTYVSACHFLRADARGDDAGAVAVRRQLLTTALVVFEAVERWLDEVQPDIVIAESGAHLVWKIAFELARARGIRVVCREIGKGGWDSQIHSLNAEAMFPGWPDAWAEARRTPLPREEVERVERYIAELPGKTYSGGARLAPFEDAAVVRQSLNLTPGRPVVALFTNVAWDLATAGRDAGFDGMYDWIFETLKIAGRTREVDYVVRVHPAENSVLTRERVLDRLASSGAVVPPNVRLVGPERETTVRSLCGAADLVAVYCSTAGIEAAIYGKPVLVCGTPHYRDRGFTIDVESRTEYREMLQRWSRGTSLPLPRDAHETARRYAHLFFLRYHIDMGWTTSPLEPPYRLRIRHLSELLPGRSRAVDTVCDGILEGREILLPPPS